MIETNPVKKDMSSAYEERLKSILNDIDETKQGMIYNKNLILRLSERLNSLFIILSGKTTDTEKTKQNKLRKSISMIKIYELRKKELEGDIVPVKVIIPKKWKMKRYLLEKQEMELNLVQERLGLTAVGKDKRKVA